MYSRLLCLLLCTSFLASCSGDEAVVEEETATPAKEVDLAASDSVEVEEVESTSKFALSMAPDPEPTPEPVAAPPKKAAKSSSSGSSNSDAPGLDAGQIRTPIKRSMGQVRACYERELKKNPGLAGKISMAFTIGVDGKVRSARAAKNTTGSMGLARCVTSRVKTWVFPTAPGSTDVEYPFSFEPKDF